MTMSVTFYLKEVCHEEKTYDIALGSRSCDDLRSRGEGSGF